MADVKGGWHRAFRQRVRAQTIPDMQVDFHLHTELSDGGLNPVDLLRHIRLARLTHWAVTDHDTLAAYTILRNEPGIIPGVEVTAEVGGHEVHVVALGINPEQPAFVDFLADIRALRRERMAALIASVGESERIPLSALAPAADTLTRAHVASALVSLGRARTFGDVFRDLIGDAQQASLGLPAYPSLTDTAAAIRAAGGVAVLAHPGIYKDCAVIAGYVEHLDGLETSHPRLDPELESQLVHLADERGLLQSCGSDTHVIGMRHPGEPRCIPERVGSLVQRLVA
jgi:3',5'-nucleoside bisphosphate phosphatase